MKTPWREILIAFVIGGLVGFFAASRCHLDQPHGERKGGQMLEHFSRKLNLSADQKGKVAKILESQREKFKVMREEMRPRFEEIRKTFKAEIEAILTPEQTAKFEKLDAKWVSRRQKMRPRGFD